MMLIRQPKPFSRSQMISSWRRTRRWLSPAIWSLMLLPTYSFSLFLLADAPACCFPLYPKERIVSKRSLPPCPGTAANRFDQWPGDMFNRPTSGPAATQMSADHGPCRVIVPLLAFGLIRCWLKLTQRPEMAGYCDASWLANGI